MYTKCTWSSFYHNKRSSVIIMFFIQQFTEDRSYIQSFYWKLPALQGITWTNLVVPCIINWWEMSIFLNSTVKSYTNLKLKFLNPQQSSVYLSDKFLFIGKVLRTTAQNKSNFFFADISASVFMGAGESYLQMGPPINWLRIFCVT